VFEAARPRPVHIELPLDVITAPADHVPKQRLMPIARPGPAAEAIAVAAELLRGAERPLVVMGGGAQDAAPQARALVERLGALAVTTVNGMGILPPDHPLCLGSTLSQPPVQDELAAADVVLAVGTELGETDTLMFDGRPILGGRLIRIDIDPGQLTSNAFPEVAILSDAGLALEAFERELGDHEGDGIPAMKRAQALRKALQDLLNGQQRLHQRFLAVVREALPGVIVVGDSTRPVYSANLFYRSDQPRSYFNSSTGYGTLGYALPAALGAMLARPERPVVALVGDGGLQFTVGELATAVELELPLPILLWNNQGYGEIKNYMADRGIPQTGVDIYTPDFLTIARGFGCRAERAESLKHLHGLLEQADQETGPTLIEIDEEEALAW
jgi:acetolactate synthase-1/2/3 large subunit